MRTLTVCCKKYLLVASSDSVHRPGLFSNDSLDPKDAIGKEQKLRDPPNLLNCKKEEEENRENQSKHNAREEEEDDDGENVS